MSSASQKAISVPVATASAPWLRASLGPLPGFCASTIRGSSDAKSRISARVVSDDPSSTQIASQSLQVCACRLASVSPNVASALKQGRMIENRGMFQTFAKDGPKAIERAGRDAPTITTVATIAYPEATAANPRGASRTVLSISAAVSTTVTESST